MFGGGIIWRIHRYGEYTVALNPQMQSHPIKQGYQWLLKMMTSNGQNIEKNIIESESTTG